jgi:hypothetical protein
MLRCRHHRAACQTPLVLDLYRFCSGAALPTEKFVRVRRALAATVPERDADHVRFAAVTASSMRRSWRTCSVGSRCPIRASDTTYWEAVEGVIEVPVEDAAIASSSPTTPLIWPHRSTVLVREEEHPRFDQPRREERSGAGTDLPMGGQAMTQPGRSVPVPIHRCSLSSENERGDLDPPPPPAAPAAERATAASGRARVGRSPPERSRKRTRSPATSLATRGRPNP